MKIKIFHFSSYTGIPSDVSNTAQKHIQLWLDESNSQVVAMSQSEHATGYLTISIVYTDKVVAPVGNTFFVSNMDEAMQKGYTTAKDTLINVVTSEVRKPGSKLSRASRSKGGAK